MIKEKLKQLIQESLLELQKAGKLEVAELPRVVLEHPENSDHGDYSTNIAFLLAPLVKKSPMETAGFLAEQMRASLEGALEVRQVEIAAAGFINIHLSLAYLQAELLRALKEQDDYGRQKAHKKKMVLDYSGPNIAKAFGIGHLRSTVIGQAIYNLYSFLGWKVIGDNHLGDWGTPHGKILYELKTKKLAGKDEKEAKEILNSLTVLDLEKLYIEFGKEAEQNSKIEEEARLWFSKLEQGDKDARMMWEYTKEISLREFNRVYKLLDVEIDNALGESFYEPMLKDIVQEVRKKGVATDSQGALVISYPQEKLPPALVLKSDKATNYFTRDLATIAYRLKKWKPDVIVYETGVEQSLNFQQLFWAAELLQWAPREKFVHVAHGLYRSKEGKFSTRKGHTIHLEEVLTEAIERAKNIIKQSETAKELLEQEKEQIAKVVGIGAVKYNDLAQHPRKDIVFDWDKILNLKGNSAPYLQYTYVRAKSILQKTGFSWPSKTNEYRNLSVAELDVARATYKFGEIVQAAADTYSPNILCTYLFDLAQKYNAFYNTHQVISAETKDEKEFRLVLTSATAQVLKSGLTLLGITVLDRM